MPGKPPPSESARSFAGRTILDAFDAIADPAHHSGGGALAGVAAAGAAAVTELVLTLACRRKALVDQREMLTSLRDETQDLRHRFLSLVDRDIAAFERVMQIQGEIRRSVDGTERRSNEARLGDAYRNAAIVPIEMGEAAVALLTIIRTATPFSSRFTVSDFGAAATILAGAVDAAMLTTDINMSYLADHQRDDIDRRAESVRVAVPVLVDEITASARSRVTGAPRGDGT